MLGGAVLALTCLTGCGSIIISSGPGPTTTVVPKPSVRIGLLTPLSGPGVAIGRAIKNGAELAISQYDANSSPQVTARLDIENAAVDPAKAARSLAAKGVVGVVGPATDSEAAVADPVLERAGIPQVAVSATADDLANAGDVYFHRVAASDGEAGDAEAQWLVDKGASTVQVVDDGLSDYSTLLAHLNQTLSSDLGSQPAPYTYPARGTSAVDAAQAITSESPEPDAVVFVGSAAQGGALAEALRDLTFSGTILLGGAAGDPGSAATQAWLSTAPDGTADLASAGNNPGSVTGQALTFVTAYTGAYGVAPPEWAAQAYDATNAILDALTPSSDGQSTTSVPRITPTASDVETALNSYSATGVSGPISFDPASGDLTSPQVWISTIKNSKAVQQSSVTASSTGASS
ncbi:MAG: branched-chain amino acid ABC transporter substrate-binding protein [Acidimicrobiaceae bacterium]|nr:branched-chain amino acid ABC transporter substrate-binding protein [Acidimicrobiaceae bacterium]MBO0748693.1 branched-chain amino acid ABC transporter substrate-binding protein [Acidimicrobiaceae bacterium]